MTDPSLTPTSTTPVLLGTPRLVLRPHRETDLDDLCEFHGDPDVVRYTPWPVRDRTETRVALQRKLDQGVLRTPGEWLVLAVELRETQKVVGEVLLKWASAEHRQGELGFAFARSAHGHGYAREASETLLTWGFEQLGLHRVTAVCVEQNDASARLLERMGFTREGRLVDAIHLKGSWRTQLSYAITATVRPTADRSPGPPSSSAATVGTSDDEAAIHLLVHQFFAAFATGADLDARLDRLRTLLLPDAVITRGGDSGQVMDVDAFIEPRRTLLSDGSLTGFSERPVQGRLDIFGDVAHWFGGYVKQGRTRTGPGRDDDDVMPTGAGMKSVQFVRIDGTWRISAVAWDDERPGLTGSHHLHRRW